MRDINFEEANDNIGNSVWGDSSSKPGEGEVMDDTEEDDDDSINEDDEEDDDDSIADDDDADDEEDK